VGITVFKISTRKKRSMTTTTKTSKQLQRNNNNNTNSNINTNIAVLRTCAVGIRVQLHWMYGSTCIHCRLESGIFVRRLVFWKNGMFVKALERTAKR
jgi:hypothetical protein